MPLLPVVMHLLQQAHSFLRCWDADAVRSYLLAWRSLVTSTASGLSPVHSAKGLDHFVVRPLCTSLTTYSFVVAHFLLYAYAESGTLVASHANKLRIKHALVSSTMFPIRAHPCLMIVSCY